MLRQIRKASPVYGYTNFARFKSKKSDSKRWVILPKSEAGTLKVQGDIETVTDVKFQGRVDSARLTSEQHGLKKWKHLTRAEVGRLNFQPEKRTVTKDHFQSRLKNLLDDVCNQDIEIPVKNILGKLKPEHTLTKFLLNGSTKEETKSDTDLAESPNYDILARLVKESFLYYESPGRFGVPMTETYTKEKLLELLGNPPGLLFEMKRCAQRSKGKSVKRPNNDWDTPWDHVPRRDFITYRDLKKEFRKLAYRRLKMSPPSDTPLIIDLNFEDLMTKPAIKDLNLQIQHMIKHNITHPYPMPFIFANMKEDSYLHKCLIKERTFGYPDTFFTVTDKNLLQLDNIRTEDMIYLSPSSHEEMDKYDDTKTYIIGGLVDKEQSKETNTATYGIAKRIGIKTVKLPLSKYLIWGNYTGRKELSLDICFKILHTMRATGNWVKALKHLPFRFHRGLSEEGLKLAGDDIELIKWFDSARPSPALEKAIQQNPNCVRDAAKFLQWS